MKKIIALLIVSLVAAPAGAAQLYRWVDDKGNVEWRDTPPPPSAKPKVVQERTLSTGGGGDESMPFTVRQAAQSFPVTLWTYDCGDPCNRAKSHLARRGIPYTERDATKDLENFKKASGGNMEVPLLFVGGQRLRSYDEATWDSAFDYAGYPKSGIAGYKPKPKVVAPPPPPAPPKPPETPPEGGTPTASGSPDATSPQAGTSPR